MQGIPTTISSHLFLILISIEFYVESVFYAPSSLIVPSDYGFGLLGLISYPLASGLPLLIAAYLGSYVRARCPDGTSISSYAKTRYGRIFEVYVTFQVLLNMGVAMCAEYTALGTLYSDFVGIDPIYPIVFLGVITMTYAAAGGLFISILTDQYQSMFTILLLTTTIVYISATFRQDTFPPLPPTLQATTAGAESFFTLIFTLTSSALFADSVWQRVWAAKDNKSLGFGAFYGFMATTTVVFLSGFIGFLAAWSGRVPHNPVTQEISPGDANLAFFDILAPSAGAPIPLWILTIVCVISTTMSESAIDSFQNAITDTIVSLVRSLGFDISVNIARILLVLFNVPFMYVGTFKSSITSLYLITNMLTTCSMFPFFIGLVDALNDFISGSAALFGCLFSISSVIVYGYLMMGDVYLGLQQYFFNFYDWGAILTGFLASIVGVFLFAAAEHAFKRIKLFVKKH